jgi:hypothetical protein
LQHPPHQPHHPKADAGVALGTCMAIIAPPASTTVKRSFFIAKILPLEPAHQPLSGGMRGAAADKNLISLT